MVYVFYGADSFSLHQALQELRRQVGPPELLEANSHTLPGTQLTLAQLRTLCDAVPFLAERRLVVVEGLLSAFEGSGRGRGRERASQDSDRTPAGWEGLEAYLAALPATTLLVFVDGPLRRNNPLLARLKGLVQVTEFPPLRFEELARWVKRRVADKGGRITPPGIQLLCQVVGNNLWVLESELEKLCLYAAGQPIEEKQVRELTSQARETSMFAAVDAVLEGRTSTALGLMERLQESGAELSYIIAMLARQLRLIALARELQAQRLSEEEMTRRLGLASPFLLRKTLEQARRHSLASLKALYDRLMEADLSLKRGLLEEELALEMLVAELAGTR
ncbi:MAG: DNA polymerase III subunit delta [Dehalococcoidia bacterium]